MCSIIILYELSQRNLYVHANRQGAIVLIYEY